MKSNVTGGSNETDGRWALAIVVVAVVLFAVLTLRVLNYANGESEPTEVEYERTLP